MQRRDLVLGALALVALAATALPARSPAAQGGEGAGAGLRVGLVFDVGGRGDKSFNDAAYAGLVEAQRRYGVRFELAEPAGAEDREGAMRLFAARGFDLIIGVGHIFTRDIGEVAAAFPASRFGCVDFSGDANTPPNLLGLRFREQEASFLVGAAAGLESRSKHVGFVGGMNIPLIRKFEAGYRAGVASVCPSCVVHAAYAGPTPDAFRDPAKGKAIAASQIASGADIVFQVAGATGTGVFEAAKAAGARTIGVDRDQYDEAPSVMMTSMTKQVDVAVTALVRSVVEGDFAPGLRELGLREQGVDWVHEGPHAASMSPATVQQVEALRPRIIAGEISVPDGT